MISGDLTLLLSMYDDIANIKDNEELIITIFKKLHDSYQLKFGGITLFNREKNALGFIVGKIDTPEDLENILIWYQTFSLDKMPFRINNNDSQIISMPAEILNSFQKQKLNQPDLKDKLYDMGITKLQLIPMRTGGELMGFLVLSINEYDFKNQDYNYLLKIGNLFGTALNNARAFEELKYKEKEISMQLGLIINLVTIKDKDKLFLKLAEEINKLIPCEYVALYATSPSSKFPATFSLSIDDEGEYKLIPPARNITLSLLSLSSKIKETAGQNNIEISGELFDKLCDQFLHLKQLKEKNSINALIVLQYAYESLGEINLILGRSKPFLRIGEKEKVDLMFLQNSNTFFAGKEIDIAIHLLPQLGLILSNLHAFEEIQILTKKLEQEKNYLLDEINLTNSFQEIIGNSQAINYALNKVKQVAPLEATVLILGETGTGKELIARALHNLSGRKENAFITVNCAALPSQLIESELFGHEKGSFTGAIEKRIGKFEVADGGTLFLDEIGELALETRAKLLRVLQEKEFERIGGKSTIYSNVRIIAATNRNLEKEIASGKFRADLFFRINVFPIVVPPLSERAEDIPLLIKYFIEKYSKKIGKEVKSLRKNDLDMLVQYQWPGNIRELEHLIERAIIVSDGTNLNFEKLLGGEFRVANVSPGSFKTLLEIEKEHIINALKTANGKITGENSAAKLLDINGKTLGSRMRKLGIKRGIIITS